MNNGKDPDSRGKGGRRRIRKRAGEPGKKAIIIITGRLDRFR